MALNSFFEIEEWKSPDSDPDAAGLIGAQAIPPVTATRIVVAEDGEVEFRDEVKIDVMSGRPLDLRVEPSAERRPPQLANTIEVKCRGGRCHTNQTIVLAAYPYGFDWFAASRLKPGLYDGNRRDKKTKHAALDLMRELQTADDPQAILDELVFDPFETQSGHLTARFVGPFERTPGGHITLRNRRQEGRTAVTTALKLSAVNRPSKWLMSREDEIAALLALYGGPERGSIPKPILQYLRLDEESAKTRRYVPQTWLWGLCDDFEASCNCLRNSSQALDLLQNPEQVLSSANARMKRPGYELNGAAATYFHALAEPILNASVFKTLAGMPPATRVPALWTEGSRRLAIYLVSNIFQDAMLNLAKRLRSEPYFETETGNKEALPPSWEGKCPSPDYETVEEHEAKWKTILTKKRLSDAEKERFFKEICQQLERRDEPEIVQACGMIAAASVFLDIAPEVAALVEKTLREKSTDLITASARYALKKITNRKRGVEGEVAKELMGEPRRQR